MTSSPSTLFPISPWRRYFARMIDLFLLAISATLAIAWLKSRQMINPITAFGAANLTARRHAARITVDLTLTGPQPERITLRCPGVRQAYLDGLPCAIEGEFISAPNGRRFVIELA